MSQPFGKDAQQYLAKLILGKEVCVMWQKRDREAPRVGRLENLEIWRFGDWEWFVNTSGEKFGIILGMVKV